MVGGQRDGGLGVIGGKGWYGGEGVLGVFIPYGK